MIAVYLYPKCSLLEIFMNMLKAFWRDEEGLTMVEYAVAAALVVVVAVAGFKSLGTNVSTTMSKVNTALT